VALIDVPIDDRKVVDAVGHKLGVVALALGFEWPAALLVGVASERDDPSSKRLVYTYRRPTGIRSAHDTIP